jgi:hypothetical protein
MSYYKWYELEYDGIDDHLEIWLNMIYVYDSEKFIFLAHYVNNNNYCKKY